MASVKYVPETNTLEVTPPPQAEWTKEMEVVYRYLCVPESPDLFVAALASKAPGFTAKQRYAIGIRLANAPDIDVKANQAYFLKTFHEYTGSTV